MRVTTLSAEEIAHRGEAIYQERIRPLVEPDHHGDYVVISIDTGEYALDPVLIDALMRADGAFPNSLLHTVRVGYDAVVRFGASVTWGRFEPYIRDE